MEPLLLAKEDFADYADLPESLDLDRLRPHILSAQRQRLRPVLTDTLTDELLRRVAVERAAAGSASPAPLAFPWSTLRTKAVAVVACASMARYMPFSQTTATSNSMVRKTSQYSEAVDTRDLARQASIYDGDALTSEVALAKWLRANAAEFGSFYPQASTCCGAGAPGRTPSVVVQGIRRLDEPRRPAMAAPWERPALPVVTTPQPTPSDNSTLPVLEPGYSFTNSLSYTIVHNMGRHVSVQVYDLGGQLIDPDVSDVTLNSLTLNFSQPVSGTVVLT